MRKIEPDGILYHVETALDKITELVLAVHSRKKKNKSKFYRRIVNRRINLTNYSKQLRGRFHGDIKNN